MGGCKDQELDDEARSKIGERESVVSLSTHSDMRGLMTSNIAGAVLCVLSDGVLFDSEAGELIPASEALAWGREMESTIKSEL